MPDVRKLRLTYHVPENRPLGCSFMHKAHLRGLHDDGTSAHSTLSNFGSSKTKGLRPRRNTVFFILAG